MFLLNNIYHENMRPFSIPDVVMYYHKFSSLKKQFFFNLKVSVFWKFCWTGLDSLLIKESQAVA